MLATRCYKRVTPSVASMRTSSVAILRTIHCHPTPPRTLSAALMSTTKSSSTHSHDDVGTKREDNLHHVGVVVPDFDDAHAAFETKSTRELLRASFVYATLCSTSTRLVKHAEAVLTTMRAVFGDTVTDSLLKMTLFGHFCAGEDEEHLEPVLADLRKNGIGGILDYAAESAADEESSLPPSSSPSSSSSTEYNQPAREYAYESEAACDRHVQVFLSCIRSVAHVSSPDGFAAIKVTALGNPLLLERMSLAIVESKNLFARFDRDGDGLISREEFEHGYRFFFNDADEKLPELLETLDPNFSGQVDYISWSKFLTPKDLPAITKSCREIGPLGRATPTKEEVSLIERMHERAHTLAEEAYQCGTRLLIDAEQFRVQPAIDNLALELQQKYNATDKSDVPIIYTTYQCYLKDTLEHIAMDVERSERFDYHFACKLVRGAYMESERERAEMLKYPSPIHDTIEDTHQCYNDAVKFLLEHSTKTDKQVEVMCATHNQESIEKAIVAMDERGINPSASTLSFSQLYGMSDNLTYNLGRSGFRAYKYVPYGEVKEVMPYLMRRAQENSSLKGNASHELALLRAELFRRIRSKVGMSR